MRTQHNSGENGTQRIEAFSDGVFAIAITLLILEIKVPHAGAMSGGFDLGHALSALWPSYFAYVFSFVVIGIYWANHHYLFRLFQRSDHVFNLLNVLFLMAIAFLPFPTAVLSEYYGDPINRTAAVTFYSWGLLLPASAWSLLWLYGRRGYRLIDERLDPRFVGSLTLQYLCSPAVYALALVVSFFSEPIALTINVGLTLLYLLPPRKPVYKERTEREV